MFVQLYMVRHPKLGLGLLLVMAVLIATLIALVVADDIALVPLMTGDDIALVVLFADLQVGKYLPRRNCRAGLIFARIPADQEFD